MDGRSTAGSSSRSWSSATTDWLERLRRFTAEQLWSREPLQPAPLAWARSGLQFGFMVGRGFVRDQLLLRSHSLTFLTVLSVAPLVALAVSLAGMLGVQERLLPLLADQLAAGSPQAAAWLTEFVQNFSFGALGTVGGATLMATSILMIGNVERALNAIWGVHRQRPWVRRVPDYLAVLLIAPLVLGVAISLGTTLRSQWVVQRLLDLPGFASVYDLGLQQAPSLLMVLGFSFVYWFLPNTEVRGGSALLGGLFSGLLFTLAQLAYINLSVGAARYNALFSGLAWIPLFMIWVYFSWAITLLGAEVAFAYQTLPLYRREVREAGAGPATRESIGLALVLTVARAFRAGSPPWSDDALSEELDVPVRTVRGLIGKLQAAGVLVELGGDGRVGTYQLGRPADHIRVADVLVALRGPREAPEAPAGLGKVVTEVFAQIDRETAGAAGARTVHELLGAAEAPVDPPGTGN